ncbi:hypothetical protein CVT26_003907 [Gymnopilus dilepis]|uniref:Uncharacterized protein n=1 Tax=Gymnopilus dilepis TaxID=231916 RepID=A0A409X1I5_9AGAR|nr:hypothetical protein CVT26_003907 [Gymnopilus dilepis]
MHGVDMRIFKGGVDPGWLGGDEEKRDVSEGSGSTIIQKRCHVDQRDNALPATGDRQQNLQMDQ